MLGMSVVSLARVVVPEGLRATLAATIIFSCLVWGSGSTTTELTESLSVWDGRREPTLVMQ